MWDLGYRVAPPKQKLHGRVWVIAWVKLPLQPKPRKWDSFKEPAATTIGFRVCFRFRVVYL